MLFLIVFGFSIQGELKAVGNSSDSLPPSTISRDKELSVIYRRLATRNYEREDLSKAFGYVQQSLFYARRMADELEVARSSNLLGYIYLYWDNYSRSLDAFLSAERISQRLGAEEIQVVSLHGIARNYAYLKNIPKAMEYNRKGMAMARAHQWTTKVNGFANNASNIFQQLEQYDSSLFYLNLYMELSRQLGDKRSEVYALNNIGEHYVRVKDYSLAMHYLGLAEKANLVPKDAQASSAILGNKALVYKERGEMERSLELLRQSNRISLEKGMQRFTLDNYKSISEVYAGMGNHEQALDYLNKYLELRDGMFSEDQQRQINEMVQAYEKAELLRQDEIFLQRHRTQRLLLILSLALVALALVVIVLLISSYRLRIRLHKRLSSELSKAVDKKNRELVTALMYKGRMREVSQKAGEIMAEMEKAGATSEGTTEGMLGLKKLIIEMEGSGEEWESIQGHFNEVHPDFFRKLMELSADLTQYDLKHCAYIKMNLTTKEIGRILNISERSVQTARYRIKKKLVLGQDIDLIQMLQSI
ncbi:MAG: tetratricopeptide repeat protein [Bacteroidales bacterium]|nr:tetratricopeptide repeat protein [Bacteroidales bacterium]